MLYYNRTDIRKEIDPTKSNNSKERMICHYWFFDHGFKFQDHVCNVCHDLLCLNISNNAIINIKSVDYHCILYYISKSEAIHLLENSILVDCGYM